MNFPTMSFVTSFGLAGIGLSALCALAFAARLVYRRMQARVREASRAAIREKLERSAASSAIDVHGGRAWRAFLEEYIAVRQSVQPELRLAEIVRASARVNRIDLDLVGRLLRGSPYARAKAAFELGYIDTTTARRALSNALVKEKLRSVRLAIAHALAVIGDPAILPSLIDTLKGEPEDYQIRMRGIIIGFGDDFLTYLPMLKDRHESEICMLLLEFAAADPSFALEEYVRSILEHGNETVRIAAYRCFFGSYRHSVDFTKYVRDRDPAIRNLAIEALGDAPSDANLGILIGLLGDPDTRPAAQVAMTNLAGSSPRFFSSLNARLEFESDEEARKAIVAALAGRIEYFLSRTSEEGETAFAEILEHVLESGNVSGLVNFLNRNHDVELEDAILAIVARFVAGSGGDEGGNAGIVDDFRIYLSPRMLAKLGLERKRIDPKDRGARVERIPPAPLAILLALVAITGPGSYLAFSTPVTWSIIGYATAFLAAFSIYSLFSNFLCFALLGISFAASRRQSRMLGIKPASFLFRDGMLPSVSIVAPAYNEQASIVESVRSLLSLRYPDFEVIVVNDGSTDGTLPALIDTFKLERRDIAMAQELKTRPIHGFYSNKDIPGLLVIDKANGGKADSLNAGINASSKRYFAGIDSDSLLERDALLRLFSRFLDVESEVIASGGNIFPVNGCEVVQGDLAKIGAPRQILPLFQTIEYLRAFMNARVGWASIRGLLIISGAFGVFERKRVLEARGYMTSGEIHLKDTVGEDMELVVRLSRMMRERRLPFEVQYAYAANCWTEVPSSAKILGKQRDRWQRGLLDILTYHRKILFNPAYGSMGLIAFPYFFIFEAVGPWFETQALLLTPLALLGGPGGLMALLAAFVTNILMGIALSLSALVITEWDADIFPLRDRLRLVAAAIAENFGFRQWVSFIRVKGYLNAMRGKTGWGSMTRTGLGAGKKTPNRKENPK